MPMQKALNVVIRNVETCSQTQWILFWEQWRLDAWGI